MKTFLLIFAATGNMQFEMPNYEECAKAAATIAYEQKEVFGRPITIETHCINAGDKVSAAPNPQPMNEFIKALGGN